MFQNWSQKAQILGNLEISDGEKIQEAVEKMKFSYQKDSENYSKQEIVHKKWAWCQDNREIHIENFCPILKIKLDSDVI